MSRNSQAVRHVLLAAAAQTAAIVGHFAYGAHRFAEPLRLHVVGPALGLLAAAGALAALSLWRPGRVTLGLLVAEVGLAFVGLFGGFHGGWNHAAKDLLHHLGASPERLAEIFASPDFAPPGDLPFELSGLLTLAVAGVVAVALARLVEAARR